MPDNSYGPGENLSLRANQGERIVFNRDMHLKFTIEMQDGTKIVAEMWPGAELSITVGKTPPKITIDNWSRPPGLKLVDN
ncbi:MAG: hypothetical protein JNK47_02810 [Mesorhizobium sp.]|nr:hypothetical protein [Mesorhizobium sp.]MBL8576131.1 hypothetical protein [Mesorhizobium sp.]